MGTELHPPETPGLDYAQVFAEAITILEELDPNMKGTEDTLAYKAAAILLVSVTTGADISLIATVTGYNLNMISKIAARLWESGLWDDTGVHYDEWDQGDMAFWIHTLVATGDLKRSLDPRSREPRYIASPHVRAKLAD